MNEVLERIDMILKSRGLRSRDIQKATGLSSSSISSWYQRDRPPGTEQMIKLLQYLQVDANYILGLDYQAEATPQGTTPRERLLRSACKDLSDSDFILVLDEIEQIKGQRYIHDHPEEIEEDISPDVPEPDFTNIDKEGEF